MFHIRQLFRLFPLFSVAIAAAQTLPPGPFNIPTPLSDWALGWHCDANGNSDVDPALAGQAVSGDFTGNGVLDIVQICGPKLHVYLDVGGMDARLRIDLPLRAIACMPHVAANTSDRLAYVDANGFGFLDFNPSATSEGNAFTATPLSWSGAWATTFNDARALCCADIDADGDQDFLVLASDTKKVYRLINDGTGVFQPANGFTSNLGIQEMFALQWDDVATDPALEVAVVDSVGLKIFEPDGARRLLVNADIPNMPGFIAKIAQDYGPSVIFRDAVAWVSYSSNGVDQHLSVIELGAPNPQPTINLPSSVHVFSITAGDMDNDGDGDLVFSTRVNNIQSKRSYTNARSILDSDAVRFSSAATDVDVAFSCTPSPADHASVVIADLNGDRLRDTYVCVPSGPCALAILNGYPLDDTETGNEGDGIKEFAEAETPHPLFISSTFFTAEYVNAYISAHSGSCCSNKGTLMLNCRNVWALTDAGNWRIEVGLWRQLTNGSGTLLPPEPSARQLSYFDCDVFGDDPNAPAEFELPIAIPTEADALYPSEQRFRECYYLRFRCVNKTATNPPQPDTYVLGLTGDPLDGTVMSYPYLKSLPGAWSATIPFTWVELDPSNPPYFQFARPKEAGGTVPQARMPPFPNGQIPTTNLAVIQGPATPLYVEE